MSASPASGPSRGGRRPAVGPAGALVPARAAQPCGERSRDPRESRTRRVAALVAVPLLAACADTVNPTLGGLKLGVSGSSFHVPVLVNEELPFQYPREAWKARVGGETRLRIHITERGRVDSAYVLRSAGHPALDSAALAGAARLRYRPARQGTDPVGVWAVLPVRYPLPEEVEEP